MINNQRGGVNYLTFESFQDEILHGVFTRHGGVSNTHAASLNVGGTVGDAPESVRRNKQILFETLNKPAASMFDCWQVHGPDYILANSPHNASTVTDPREYRADGLITNNSNVTLFMRFADCTPILLYDPVKKVIGLVHAGWQGTVKKAGSNMVKGFVNLFGSNPADLLAGIGPAIGPDHYIVGKQVIDAVSIAFGEKAKDLLLPAENDKKFFDMWEANRYDLETAGVRQIEVSGICTACNTQDWFSHRAEKGKTGRFGVLMALKA